MRGIWQRSKKKTDKERKTKVSDKTTETAEKTAEKMIEERIRNEQVEKLAGVILANKKRTEECAEKIKTAQQEILKLLNGATKPVDTPTAYVSVRKGATRLNAKKAEAIYTVEKRPELYKFVPDAAAFKILLSDEENKALYVGQPRNIDRHRAAARRDDDIIRL